jgi:hypothetical protein
MEIQLYALDEQANNSRHISKVCATQDRPYNNNGQKHKGRNGNIPLSGQKPMLSSLALPYQ